MCSVYEHNKNILTSSTFDDATIFHDIEKKKKKSSTGYFFLSSKFRGHVDKGGIRILT